MTARNLLSGILALSLVLFDNGFCQDGETGSSEARPPTLQDRIRNKMVIPSVTPHWFANDTRFWYWRDRGNGERECILVDAVAGKREPAFDHKRMAAVFSKETGKEVSAFRLPFREIEFVGPGRSILIRGTGGVRWECFLDTYRLEKKELSGRGNSGETQFLNSPKPSRGGGEEIHVNVLNGTGSPLDVYWIDNGGRRKHYRLLLPGKEWTTRTFRKHVWYLEDKGTGKGVGFEAERENETVIISGSDLRNPINRKKKKVNQKSPDGKWELWFKNDNLWGRRIENGQPGEDIQLTSDGTGKNKYVGPARWSPDSSKLIITRQKPAPEHLVHLIESSPEERVQPRLKSYSYLKPGDPIAVSKPCLIDFSKTEPREISVADELFDNPWRLSDFTWMPDSKSFSFLYNQRGHQLLRLISVDASSGETRSVIEERSDTFIDYAGKKFLNYSKSSGEWIWMSERDGWNHLYLYDADSGAVKNQITQGGWVVRGVDRVDEETRQIWFRAGGIYPDQDPYYIHHCRVNFDGSDLVVLTEADGAHQVEFSPDRKYLLVTHSRVDSPPVIELWEAGSGKKVCELEKADWSELRKTGWQVPERFVAKGRDNETDIHGVIYRPSNFEPGKKYPVIEKIYAGPHGSFVPKEFRTFHSAQGLAEYGFIVVQIDGMGTSHRSKAFHNVAWKNLRDSGFPDRIRWLKHAARKHPEMDLSRVGIYGGSAGGQSAMAALLWHGDFYKVAVADCGCHDNRMDKIWWNELWMGWPVDKSYEENSNVANAHKLTGHLLLTAGELDRNVDPASTMQVVNALIKADKDFDMIVVPGAGHGVGETRYMKRRRAQYFARHLLGEKK